MKKAYKGGYKIISLGGLNLGTDETTIKGIHEAIESSYGKPLLIEDIVIDGVEKQSVFVTELKVVNGSFVFDVYNVEVSIDEDDYVASFEKGLKKDITIVADYNLEINDGDEITINNNSESLVKISLEDGLKCIIEDGLVGNAIEELLINSESGNYIKFQSGVGSLFIKRISDWLLITAHVEV